MQRKKLFNIDGDDTLINRRMIKGNVTNLFNLNNVKYQWANKLYRLMMENFWIPEKVSLFDDKRYNVGENIENPDAIMVRSAAMHDMEFGDELLAIARAGAGVNNIPIDTCSEKGIVVFNTPGANANAVKELVICGLLLSSRKVVSGIKWAETLKGNGTEVGKMVENLFGIKHI